MTRLGDLLKVLVDKCSNKRRLNILGFLGYLEKYYFLSKMIVATFRATFGKCGLLFISTSGHTENEAISIEKNVLSSNQLKLNHLWYFMVLGVDGWVVTTTAIQTEDPSSRLAL